MAMFDICAYRDQALHGAGGGILPDGGTITGHHIIPDHCFYYTSGLRGHGDLSGFLCPSVGRGYSTAKAPVIIVDADANGGKSRRHGLIHSVFDPIELSARIANGNQWTYGEAKAAAIRSVVTNCGRYSAQELGEILDEYFMGQCLMDDHSVIRAGETGTMKTAPEPRRSHRNLGPRAKPY
ncbi:MAG: hypothetical protein JNJ44_10440 [Zoogloeaceae bacterium]|nr:hypothetical protein [Zoogloeaceae bacterium]